MMAVLVSTSEAKHTASPRGKSAADSTGFLLPNRVSNDAILPRKARALSSLDTLGITRPEPWTDDGWLDAVGESTKEHREAKARALDAQAVARERAARMDGKPETIVKAAGKWHRARAKGQRRRIEAVKGCRRESIIATVCEGCGTIAEKAGRCSVGLLCKSCRGSRAHKKRGNFDAARKVVVQRAELAGLLRHARRGGRWSDKMFTLTAPQLAHVDVEERIVRVRAAWPYFLKRLNAWLRARGADEHSAWFRHDEWEPGEHDGKGHPHIHVWLFSPYLPWEDLREWWRDALELAGYNAPDRPLSLLEEEDDELRNVVTDIREAKGANVGLEVIKYLTKDITRDGRKLDAELYARVVNMFDGARTTQSSRGFMALANFKPMCACGACEMFSVRILDQQSVMEMLATADSAPRGARAPP